MPIRPENLHRYPADWMDVRLRILQRAGFCCEWDGCVARQHEVGFWYQGKWHVARNWQDRGFVLGKPALVILDGHEIEIRLIRVVLTVAHKDHTPENCADDNLAAWCQRHHLAYDAEHHAITRARTRHAQANTLELPLEDSRC